MGLAFCLLKRPQHFIAVSKGGDCKPLLGRLITTEYEHMLILLCRRWQSLQACVPDSQEPEDKCHLK